MKEPNWDNFLLVVAKSLEVFVKVMVVLIAPRLQLQAQLTVASLGSCHRSGECAKSCVHRSVCACNQSGGAASSIRRLT
jgi:hypothetical protein